jgi:hypothetical protein
MRLTWQGIVLLAVIAYSVGSGMIGDRRAQAEAADLASTGACGVASTYVEWRLAFEDGMGDADVIKGEPLRTYRARSSMFAQAARSVGPGHGQGLPRAEARLMEVLARMAETDADRSTRTASAPEAFLEQFVEACPLQALAVFSWS